MRWIAFLAVAAAMAFAPARAYTPESGVWWNPDEPGSGLQIEVQDNFIAVFGYAYDDDGFPIFVTAQGFLSDDATRFESTNNPNDGSWLTTYFGGQCIGCPYPGFPEVEPGSEGRIVIQFDPNDPTRATLTWGGRTVDIERYQFYLKRPEDAAPIETTRMLGEWNATMDFTESANNNTGIQYFGEVMVIDLFDFDEVSGTWFYEGCRPEGLVDGFCSDAALASTDLAGFYDPEFDVQVIVITDSRDQAGNPLNCLLYDVRAGTNMFEGGLDDDFDGSDDGGVALYPCGAANVYGNYDFFPVRGFRSASRSFVQDGVGPSRAASGSKAKANKGPGLPLTTAAVPKTIEDSARAERRMQLLRMLEARLGVK